MHRYFQSRQIFFFVTDEKGVHWVNLWKYPHIWRRLNWCWLIEHIYSLFIAKENIVISWNLSINGLFSQHSHFLYQIKSECTGWILWKFPAHFATSTLMLGDWKHLKFVLHIRGHSNELIAYHEEIVQSRQVIFCNRQKVRVLVEFVKIFPTFGDMYTDVEWLNTSVVCSLLKSTS